MECSDLAHLSRDNACAASNSNYLHLTHHVLFAWLLVALAHIFMTPMVIADEHLISSDSGFETAILSTIRNHPALVGQQARIEAKKFSIAEARSLRLPSLNGQLGRDVGSDESFDATLLLRQPIWTFGRISSEIEYAHNDHDVELAASQALRRDLAERTEIAYALVLGARHRQRASENDTDTLTALVDQIRRRAKARLASAADVALAESRLVQMRSTTERLGTELALAEAELLALTQTPVKADRPIPSRYTLALPLAQVEATALNTAPSLSRGERLIALARAGVARERARALPTVYLEGRSIIGNDDDDEDLRFGIVIEGGIDGLGTIQANRARALDANARTAEADLALARTEVKRRARTLHASRDSHRALIDGYKSSIDRLDSVLDSYRRQYEAGRKEWLELLNLYREVAELRLQLEQAHTDWTTDSISLAAATGQMDNFPFVERTP